MGEVIPFPHLPQETYRDQYTERVRVLERDSFQLIIECIRATAHNEDNIERYVTKLLTTRRLVDSQREKYGRNSEYPFHKDGHKIPLLQHMFRETVAPFVATHYDDLEGRRERFIEHIKIPRTRTAYNDDIVALGRAVRKKEHHVPERWDELSAMERFLTEERYQTYVGIIKRHIESKKPTQQSKRY